MMILATIELTNDIPNGDVLNYGSFCSPKANRSNFHYSALFFGCKMKYEINEADDERGIHEGGNGFNGKIF